MKIGEEAENFDQLNNYYVWASLAQWNLTQYYVYRRCTNIRYEFSSGWSDTKSNGNFIIVCLMPTSTHACAFARRQTRPGEIAGYQFFFLSSISRFFAFHWQRYNNFCIALALALVNTTILQWMEATEEWEKTLTRFCVEIMRICYI